MCAFAVGCQLVDYAHFPHRAGTVHFAVLDQAFGLGKAGFTRDKTHRTHAREQIEQDFGKPHLRVLFGDHVIAGDGALESAAQGRALYQ